MNKFTIFSMAVLCAVGIQAGSYEQDFEGYANGATDLGDETTVSGSAYVFNYSDLNTWSALSLTQGAQTGQIGNFVIGNLNGENVVTGFTATFDSMIEAYGGAADGFSFNFGSLASSVSGGEEGMDATGPILSICWDTYSNGAGDPVTIGVNLNGEVFTNSTVAPVIQTSLDGSFTPVSIVWDGDGLDVIYGATTVFSNLAIDFSAESGAEFAFAARTGASTEFVFIDNVNITAVPEPASAMLLGIGAAVTLLIRRRLL